jgi:hypothetical protein
MAGVLPVKSPKLPTNLPLSKTWYASSTSDGPARASFSRERYVNTCLRSRWAGALQVTGTV